ncbi:uncharacterized protein LOC127798039 [Diospyros lotus]|uniref:uncharacterized protein LOC127798039 n=1 Tax=Diospyros lotus TaxID=55363 RepID=UPI002250F0B2|nr:uncharacterized protein LOC127798039 [Diospyros lotus]
MEKKSLFISFVCRFLASLVLFSGSKAIESPQFTVIQSYSNMEIRLYKESSWMSALERGGTSFENSTKQGFHRLYQYIHGANLNSSQLAMTAPVLTTISTRESNYIVRLYLPNGAIPRPNPELNLGLDRWRSHCLAVRKFSGIAKDGSVEKEMEALRISLEKIWNESSGVVVENRFYTIAQYSAPFQVSGRVNEVWMNVSGLTGKGCLPLNKGQF